MSNIQNLQMYAHRYIPEYDLMREVLIAFQGLPGRIIRQDADGRFTITKSCSSMIDPTQRMLLEKLTSFGWLVNRIKNHINSVNKDPAQGKVSKCLAAALNNELFDYYHMVTQIEQQLQKCASQENGRTRASTPTSELYGGVENRPAVRPSATFESLQTALALNGYNGNQQANSDDGFGSQMYSNPSSNASPTIQALTLHQIHYLSLDHYFKLKTLAMLVECCKGERGGHLARIVYRFMQQGDKQIRAIITRILSQVVLPIRHMLSHWIFHGEIQDPFDEFFICQEDNVPEGLMSSVTMMSLSTNPINNNNLQANYQQSFNNTAANSNGSSTFTSLATTLNNSINQHQQTTIETNKHLPVHMRPHRGHRGLPISSSMTSLSSSSVGEKQYIINDYMMPGFISRRQANKILATGKAVHLLRKVCTESVASSVPGYDDLKKSFESTSVETLFRSKSTYICGEENEFEDLLNTAHKEVSQKALELLFGNYKLRSHFRGLKQYLLLGQGDFIRHLMDMLKTELDKPSSECRFHNILSVLECAMRSTNVQYDEPDVTNRLDCILLDAPSPNASGWDVFSLVYRVDGPISTIFTEEKIRDYIDIFKQLWRTKRFEHVLTSLWSDQMSQSKRAAIAMPLLSPSLHQANILLSRMLHFIQHYQNYIMFEVVECAWVELVAATDVAKDVDDVVAAHDAYLRNIKSGTLCQEDILFDCISEFEQAIKSLWKDIDGDLRLLPDSEKVRFLTDLQNKIHTLAIKFQRNQKSFRRESSQTSHK